MIPTKAIDVDGNKDIYVQRNDPPWPRYNFRLNEEGEVIQAELIYSFGSHQIYERSTHEDLLISYRRGRFGCEQVPAGLRLGAFLDRRGKPSSDSSFKNSESQLVRKLDVGDVIVIKAFNAKNENEIQKILNKYNLKKVPPGPKFKGKSQSLEEFFGKNYN